MDPRIHEQDLCARMHIPVSILPTAENMQCVMAARNERSRYHRTCDKTGKKFISAYPPDSAYTVYANDVWWGDSWEAMDYGRDFSFAKQFFEQFTELQHIVPREGATVFRSENCDYNSHIRDSKNCYLNSLVANSEDAYYSYWVARNKDIIDCVNLNDCTLCYECVDVNKSYNCAFLQDCNNCNNCFFCYQLSGCKNCILSSNLINKEFYVRNKKCSKEEFEAEKKKLLSGSHQAILETRTAFAAMQERSIHRAVQTVSCENATGDHLGGCRNCFDCYDCFDGNEDCRNVVSMADSKDVCQSYSVGWPRSEMVYCCNSIRGSTNIAYCSYIFFSSDLRYCDSCQSCKNCLGCTGLRRKEYCILNKQYSKEEYELLAPKIIEHMKKADECGRFFPHTSLPHAYNETAAQKYFPLTKEEVLKRGWNWRDLKDDVPKVDRIIAASELPDSLSDIPDDILNWAIECEATKRPFRIIKQELNFYRNMGLPIPRLHPEERHRRKVACRNPHTLWKRECGKCGEAMQTTYSPERPEIVYCEECYLKEVY